MGQYTNKGLLNGYKKNNKERAALDYYATPTKEVTNILEIIGIDLTDSIILEPCAGGGHMLKGIIDYAVNNRLRFDKIISTDVQKRDLIDGIREDAILSGEEYDFLSDDYPFDRADYVIMNPPYSTIEPFTIRGLEIAQKGLLLLGRLQYLESQSKYEKIFKNNPPTDVYIYVDRISCFRNGDMKNKESSAQAYAWFYWDKTSTSNDTKIHWIRRK